MKIHIKGTSPKLVIADMRYDSQGYCPFLPIIITRLRVFISVDIEVFSSIEELYEAHGNGAMFFSIMRKKSGRYKFNFGNLFKEKVFSFYPDYYDYLLGNSQSFIKLGNECFEIHDLKSAEYYYDKSEMEQDIQKLDNILGLKALTLEELEKEEKKAALDENYVQAAKCRDEISNRSSQP